MSRSTKKLSALEVNRINEPGRHPLGDRLYLQITESGAKSWIFRYFSNGKSKEMGLGSAKSISLGDIRIKMTEIQKDLANGVDPLKKKVDILKVKSIEEAKQITFDQCATRFIDAHKPSWKHPKHISQWSSSLENYVSPIVGKLSVADIDTTLVIKILEPLWYTKPETASRVRARLERVLSWASVRGYRSIENPARWRGHLDQLLPKRSTIQQVSHFEAMESSKVPGFIQKLRGQKGVSPLALEFLILTATRTNETLGAKWEEFNFEDCYWLIPGERMKTKREHRIPLCPRATQILEIMREYSSCDYVFPGVKNGSQLSSMALLNMIRGLGYASETSHGFRSTFADWANENTEFSRETIESSLAHLIKNRVERAYNRSDLFAKRRLLMEAWGNYCGDIGQSIRPQKSNVISINS